MNPEEPITKKERRERRWNEEFAEGADLHRILPASGDAELGVLGSILISQTEVLESALEKGITAAHFHVPAHGRIFEVLCGMKEKGKPLDFITLTGVLRDMDELDRVGGPAFVTNLFTFIPTAANADFYIETLQEKFVAREIIRIASAAASRAYDGSQDPYALLEDLQGQVIEIGQAHAKQDNLRTIKEGMMDSIDAIQTQYESRGDTIGLATGFHDFDRMTGGLMPGQYFIIAARPSMGKSAVAMNIVDHVAMVEKQPVAVFSLEMTYPELCMRLLCARAPLNIKRVRDGFLANADFERITTAVSALASAPIYVDDTAGLSAFEFRARARRAVLKRGVKLIVVDYLQLMKSTSKRAQSDRQQEISEISSAIRETAKQLGVPIIAVAQLGRDVDQRKGHRPQLSDLRESGSLEQDAHIVAFMLRPGYYAKDEGAEENNEALMILAKQRNGPTGDIQLIFQKEFARFQSATQKLYSNNEEERQH